MTALVFINFYQTAYNAFIAYQFYKKKLESIDFGKF